MKSVVNASIVVPIVVMLAAVLLVSATGEDTGAILIPAHEDIPDVAVRAYVEASQLLAARPDEEGGPCPVSWALLAGIGKVETNHGRFAGSTALADGQVVPPILGVVLDGSLPGTRPIRDTDGGRLDGNRVFDRAVGPMQFIPGTWATFGQDADDNGIADPQNLFDSTAAAADYLCRAALDPVDTDTGRRQAIGAYNRSRVYVEDVLRWMVRYLAEATFPDGPAVLAGDVWTNPAPGYVRVSSGYGNRVHPISGKVKLHAGLDLACPLGSAIVAASSGRVSSTRYEGGAGFVVWMEHVDGVRTRYLHLQTASFMVSPGEEVQTGQHIANCGSTGGSTGPHLHFEVYPSPNSGTTDPQAFLARRGVVLS